MEYFLSHWLEWFGVITGLLYLYLEIKQRPSMWIIGFISSLVYVIVFFQTKFYADGVLNSYYVAVSVYGFWLWLFGKSNTKDEKPVQNYIRIVPKTFFILLAVTLVLFVTIYFVLTNFTDSSIPLGDSLVTSLSIVATWMLAKKIIEHWVVWVVVNGLSVFLFIVKGLYPTSFLYLCYGVLSVVGYFQWKHFKEE